MERKLSQKEMSFLKELEALLLRSDAGITVLMGRVSFFIDNVEEGDCVPTEDYLDAKGLSHIIEEGKARLLSSDEENQNSNGRVRTEELRNQSSDEPVKMSVEQLIYTFRQTGVEGFVDHLIAGRWVLDVEEPGSVTYSYKVFKELVKEVSNIADMSLRTSIFKRLMSYKEIK